MQASSTALTVLPSWRPQALLMPTEVQLAADINALGGQVLIIEPPEVD